MRESNCCPPPHPPPSRRNGGSLGVEGRSETQRVFGVLFSVIQKQPLSNKTLSKIVPAAAAAACFKGRGESGDSFCNVPFSEVSVLGIPRAAVAVEQAAARGGDEKR